MTQMQVIAIIVAAAVAVYNYYPQLLAMADKGTKSQLLSDLECVVSIRSRYKSTAVDDACKAMLDALLQVDSK